MSMQEIVEDIEDVDPSLEVEDLEEEIVEADPFEDEAREFGWTDADQWKSDSGKHMSAEAFMTRGPGLNRKQQRQIDELTNQVTEVKAQSERTNNAVNAAAEARIAASEKRIRQEMREAAESGDMGAYDQKEKELSEISKPKVDNTPSQQDMEAVAGWIGQNQLFNTDPVYKGVANAVFDQELAAGKSVAEILPTLADKVREELPHKFQSSPKPKPPAVEQGGVRPVKKRGKGWGDIPSSDRSAVQDQIDDGLFDDLAKEMKVTPQEAYAAKYWEL